MKIKAAETEKQTETTTTTTETFIPIKKVKHKTDKIVLKWGAVTGAEGYDIFAAFCGRDIPDEPTMTVARTKATLTKAYNLDGNSKITNDCIKYIIKAYKTVNGQKTYIAKSNIKIKAVGVGTCKIYVVAANGLTKTVKVTVK